MRTVRRNGRLLVRTLVTMLVVHAGVAVSASSPASAAPVEGRGTTVGSYVTEYSYSWRASMSVEGTFAVNGLTYGYFGTVEAWNYCCSYMGTSGSGYWYFNGFLIGAGTFAGAASSSSSSSMSYTRTPIVNGVGSTLAMRMSGPAHAYLPDGSSVNFNLAFDFSGVLTGGDVTTGLCGFYPGCSYTATYRQQDTPSLVEVSPTGGATSTGVSVGWDNSATYGGLACVSVTGSCSGGSVVNVCPSSGCSRELL